MNDIKCPICGEMNSANSETCSNCLSQLRQGTDALRDLGKRPIQPGQVPTKKTTSELEPILPQWLQDARSQTSSTPSWQEGDNNPQINNQMPLQQPPKPSVGAKPVASSGLPDLLAGLQSQANEEEDELPSWLTGLAGGVEPTKAKPQEPPSFGSRRVELRGGTGQLPPLKNQSESAAAPRITATQAPSEKRGGTGELPPWLAETMANDVRGQTTDDLPGWQAPSVQGGVPEAAQSVDTFGVGLAGLGESDAPVVDNSFAQSGGLDWMNGLQSAGESAEFKDDVQDQSPFDSGTPDWLSGSGVPAVATSVSNDTPDWLASLDAGPAQSDVVEQASSSDTPSWLSAFESPSVQPAVVNDAPSLSNDDAPAWLSGLGSEQSSSSAFSEPPVAPVSSASATPDWMNDLGSPSNVPVVSASNDNLNSLFSETPDWLSKVEGGNPVTDPFFGKADTSNAFAPGTMDDVAPADLPSWVQAMRPVDTSVISGSQASTRSGASEAKGPLAGLQGVLPAMSFLPTSKPRAYSIKLQATDEHQGHSALMEKIIEAETTPLPIVSIERVISQRGLRRSLFVIYALMIIAVLLVQTRIFSLPVAVPIEINSAISVAENIAENSPVLVVFDYDPGLSSEMEAIAVPLVDHMILLKHPRLTFVSTSPYGDALAERFISVSLRDRNYQRGIQFVNFGYLPGGLAGVRVFASAMPQGGFSDVTAINQFSAIVVITDNADDGRVWIEQTNGLRGSAPILIASSAQASPMLYPYYRSGQVAGMINGLHGAAIVEQRNAGLPGTARRYWDAYAISLFLAVGFILLGGLWNLFAGLNAKKLEAQ